MRKERRKIDEFKTDVQKVEFLLEYKDKTSLQNRLLLFFSLIALVVLGYSYYRLNYLF